MRNYVVKSSDGTFFGPFHVLEEGQKWAEKNEDLVGDWCMFEVFPPEGNYN